MLQRKQYMDKLLKLKNEKIIKVVTGVRRCGKSTLLQLFMEQLRKDGVTEERIVFLNFEDIRFEQLKDYRTLYCYVSERLT